VPAGRSGEPWLSLANQCAFCALRNITLQCGKVLTAAALIRPFVLTGMVSGA